MRDAVSLLRRVMRHSEVVETAEKLTLVSGHEYVVMRVEYHRVGKVVREDIVDIIQQLSTAVVVSSDPERKTHDTPPTASRCAPTKYVAAINHKSTVW